MKRYAVFTARFALVPTISGTFVVSMTGRASILEWAHTITGFATIYLIIGLLLVSAKNRLFRPSILVALAAALVEAIPGVPRLHAAVSPVLFAVLVWAVMMLPPHPESTPGKSRWIFALPALVLLPIFYGVGYRHQTSGVFAHVGAALPVAGLLLIFCVVWNERHPARTDMRRACNLMIAVLIVQVVFGITALIIRMLEIDSGLFLAVARTAHITGASLVLGASTELAIQYRRSAPERGVVRPQLISKEG